MNNFPREIYATCLLFGFGIYIVITPEKRGGWIQNYNLQFYGIGLSEFLGSRTYIIVVDPVHLIAC